MRRPSRRSAPSIYTLALIWLLCALMLPAALGLATVFAVLLEVGGVAVLWAFLSKRRRTRRAGETAKPAADFRPAAAVESAVVKPAAATKPAAPAAQPKPAEEDAYPPEVSAVIRDGRMALREMGRLRGTIADPTVKEKINSIMVISEKIIRDAIDDPADVPLIRRFLDFYLPTTLKLLNAYDRMDSVGAEGENISGSKQHIADMLDSALEAYNKQLDSLFANQALDIDADIRAMSSMLAQEGIGGSLDWNIFKQEYDNKTNEKGTTENG